MTETKRPDYGAMPLEEIPEVVRERGVWAGPDGFAYDGARLREHSKGGAAPGGGA